MLNISSCSFNVTEPVAKLIQAEKKIYSIKLTFNKIPNILMVTLTIGASMSRAKKSKLDENLI